MRTLIHNVEIADGSGREPFHGWVIIHHNAIESVGENQPPTVSGFDHCIDGKCNLLTPGFIDAHGHSDLSIFTDPTAKCRLLQGITTEITGNCGLSPFPVTHKNREHLEDLYRIYNTRIDWYDFRGYADTLRRAAPGIHISALTGHNTLRAACMGYENGEVTHRQINEMKKLLSENLAQGSCGLSLGLLYNPGKFAASKEILSILHPLAEQEKVLTAHLRSEGDQLLESLDEMILFKKSANLSRIHISHLKTALEENWHKIDEVMQKLDQEPDMTADRYPYTEGMTSLSVIAPEPFAQLNDSALSETLQNSDQYQSLRQKLLEIKSEKWSKIRLVHTRYPKVLPYCGKMFSEICTALSCEPHDLCAEILKHDALYTMAAFGGMSESNMKKIIASPYTACGSDENTRSTDPKFGRPHPRGYGSMPNFFKFAREYCSVGETIRKMTALPASIFGLSKRGLIRAGYFADLTLLNPDTFIGRANFENPYIYAEGIHSVWVNGLPAVREGELMQSRHGTII